MSAVFTVELPSTSDAAPAWYNKSVLVHVLDPEGVAQLPLCVITDRRVHTRAHVFYRRGRTVLTVLSQAHLEGNATVKGPRRVFTHARAAVPTASTLPG